MLAGAKEALTVAGWHRRWMWCAIARPPCASRRWRWPSGAAPCGFVEEPERFGMVVAAFLSSVSQRQVP